MRRILLVLLIAMSVTALYATGTTEQAASAPPVVPVLSGGWFGTNYNEVETIRMLEEQINIEIEYLGPGGFGDDLIQRQQVMMAGRDYPEIMVVTSAAIEVEYSNAGALLPLNDYFDQYSSLASYLPASTTVCATMEASTCSRPRRSRRALASISSSCRSFVPRRSPTHRRPTRNP